MAAQKQKKLIIYLSALAVTALVCILLSVFWQPFHADNMNTYSAGLIGTYLTANAADISEGVVTAVTAIMFAAVAVLAYCLGSINFANMTSRALYNEDIRKYGSKNAGMTNMFRVYGKTAGIYTLAGDALKTAAAVFFGRLIGGETVAYLAAMFCVLGHIAPIKYKFKGGKGVLSSAIAVLCLDPEIFAILLCVFALVLLIWRYVSLASVIAAFVYPGLVIFFANVRFGTPPQIIPLVFALFVGLFIILMHRSNLQRISERTENKFSFKKKKKDGDGVSDKGDKK